MSLLSLLFLEGQEACMEILIGGWVDDLRIEGLFILMLAVDAPIDSLFAARGKAYAVHVQGVEFWRFGR